MDFEFIYLNVEKLLERELDDLSLKYPDLLQRMEYLKKSAYGENHFLAPNIFFVMSWCCYKCGGNVLEQIGLALDEIPKENFTDIKWYSIVEKRVNIALSEKKRRVELLTCIVLMCAWLRQIGQKDYNESYRST